MNDQQPYRPPFRGQNRYEAFKNTDRPNQENQHQIVQSIKRKDFFTVTIIASTNIGGNMDKQALDERQFLIDLIFKPNEPGLKLRPEETQLLLSYIGEILKEIEAEERAMSEE
jgi:hypothetical protein